MQTPPSHGLSRRGTLFAAMAFWADATGSALAAGTAKPRASALPLVVLDPGHGGKDPGAIGVSGAYEKHVAFAAAGTLAQLLRDTGRYRVAQTRTSDVFIALEQRVAWAQARGAALFMSLHADAMVDRGVRGASVYTLGVASDAQSAALARRENAADRFGPGGIPPASPEVAKILAGLIRQETRSRSARMAKTVVASLQPGVPMLNNPARHADFAVLKAADIPSVLVEMGFMSNPQDEAQLLQPGHRAAVAAALHRAVDGFFAADTHVATAG